MLRTIKLYGKLAELCGVDEVELVGDTLRIITSGLASRFGSPAKQFIRENNWEIINEQNNQKRGMSEQEVDNSLGASNVIHFFPVVTGAGGRTGQIIAGIVLIVVGAAINYLSGGSLSPLGNSLITAGIGMIIGAILAPSAPKQREKPEERASFMFNGPTNTSEQGGPVPVVYGRFKTGSVVVSAGIDVEEIQIYTSPVGGNSSPDNQHGVTQAIP